MARLAQLRRSVVVLGAQAFHAKASVEHEPRRAGRALERSLPLASAAEMVAFLTAVFGLEEALGALRVALAGRELPPQRAGDALIPSGSGTSLARQVALGAHASVAVVSASSIAVSTGRGRGRSRRSYVPVGAGGSALAALQLEAGLADGAVQSRDAGLAGMETRHALPLLHVGAVETARQALPVLEEQRRRTGQAPLLPAGYASLARGVTRSAVRPLVVLGCGRKENKLNGCRAGRRSRETERRIRTGVAFIAAVRHAFSFPVEGPVFFAGQTQGTAAGGTASRAFQAFLPFLVGVMPRRTGRDALSGEGESARLAGYALGLARAVAGLAGGVTGGAAEKRKAVKFPFNPRPEAHGHSYL